MKKWALPQLLALTGSVVAVLLLLWLPRTPSTEAVPVADASAASTLEERMDEAVALVNGPEPMQGIMMLRELEQEHPDNAELQMRLGMFSVQSGQMEKALQRFKRVVELDREGHPEALAMLGRTYLSMDSVMQAKAALEEYKQLVSDPEALAAADRMLEEIENPKESEQNAVR